MVAVEAVQVFELVIDLKCGSRHDCSTAQKLLSISRTVNLRL